MPTHWRQHENFSCAILCANTGTNTLKNIRRISVVSSENIHTNTLKTAWEFRQYGVASSLKKKDSCACRERFKTQKSFNISCSVWPSFPMWLCFTLYQSVKRLSSLGVFCLTWKWYPMFCAYMLHPWRNNNNNNNNDRKFVKRLSCLSKLCKIRTDKIHVSRNSHVKTDR